MGAGPDQVHEHGEALAAVDDRLNRALREADGDENEAYERLRHEEEEGRAEERRAEEPPPAEADS